MLPQVAHQTQRIVPPFDSPTLDSNGTARSSLSVSARPQILPFRGSQSRNLSATHLSVRHAYPMRHTLPIPCGAVGRATQSVRVPVYDTSEHMLRRKTPNGTLAAGYDGSAVQNSTILPASKQIVLPASSLSKIETSFGDNDTSENLHPSQGTQSLEWYQQPLGRLHHTRAVPDGAPEDWKRLPPLVNGSAVILDRVPTNQDPRFLTYDGNRMQIPTVLQPPYQPCLGPTASNDSGFYGAYWPDGTFEPFRVAPTRDMGYGDTTKSNGLYTGYPSMSLYQSEIYRPTGTQAYDGPTFIHRQPPSQLVVDTNTQRRAHRVEKPTCVQEAPPKGDGNTTVQLPTQILYTPVIYSTGKHQSAQFKERVLSWAHKVYVDLLAVLHHSKKGPHQPRRVQTLSQVYSQAGLYPKPPRSSSSISNGLENKSTRSETKHPHPASRDIDSVGPAPEGRRGSHEGVSQLEQLSLVGGSAFRRRSCTTDDHVRNVGQENGKTPMKAIDGAQAALEMLTNLCQESEWRWIDGMLLGGCLAYGLEDYYKALDWYTKIISIDPSHVEAISNLAATLLSLNRQEEAEQHWLRSVKLRPSYFEAVEHLISLLCGDHRGNEAIGVIDFVERSLCISEEQRESEYHEISDISGSAAMHNAAMRRQPGFGSSSYSIPGSENGRLLALVHAKGNMLYALGDVAGASRAFEDAVLIGAGRRLHGIQGLIQKILYVLSTDGGIPTTSNTPLLLPPDRALRTAKLVFPKHGELPGLRYIPEGMAKNAAISTTSNSLLSLAKIFQDSMSNASCKPLINQSSKNQRRPSGVGDILALYYLSLSLQPSPSTANNVGILLAGVQQPVFTPLLRPKESSSLPAIPGVIPGSGVALALAYYNYGLNLDSRHAHLFTNLGSLLKDIGQLNAAIKMYEQAVACDGQFDIALANLANAVKDQGRINDAIEYYKRAVASSPDFAEAVCGLANALNSVCDWTGRGGVILEGGRYDRWHVDDNGMLCDPEARGTSTGWMKRVVGIVARQLEDGANWGRGVLQEQVLLLMLQQLEIADSGDRWPSEKSNNVRAKLISWAGRMWEGSRIVHLVERAIKRAMHRWYQDKFIRKQDRPSSAYLRPQIPSILSVPLAPTVLPFHTFTCPLSAKDIRMISERNALRISCSTLKAPWLPASVYTPPPPPNPNLNIGYVSSDFNNHPLAHLMQSVFGLHDSSKVKAFCYATTASDHSVHREQIEREAPVFRDTSSWSSDKLVQQIVQDNIHILVNLNGYTRGARNEVFAARPTPIQMSFMGFAGTLGAEWCDYLLADKIAIPPETLRPWRRNVELEDQLCHDQSTEEDDWVYSENVIFCRDTFFCCDHRQSSQDSQVPWEEEQKRRWRMRKELFPNLSDDAIILGNFNQLYKIEPTTFRTWLRILAKVPKAILWLLRFPDLGESNLKKTARLWAGEEVASRIWFTDVAPKNQHISRARICDLFLDTPECNAHTTAADVLWSSTPLLTLPRYKYKMCSRMAASILKGALPKSAEGNRAAAELIASDEDQYEEFAVRLASGLIYNKTGLGSGRLIELRKLLYESRSTSALFDTKRWVSDLECAYIEAWRRWVEGIGGDIYL